MSSSWALFDIRPTSEHNVGGFPFPDMMASPLSLSSLLTLLLGLVLSSGVAAEKDVSVPAEKATDTVKASESSPSSKTKGDLEVVTLGAGCFWCIEAVLEQIEGVENVVSGYMGGKTKDPTYEEVVKGNTGHAEVAQIHFDPKVTSFSKVLSYFWKLHDPTTLNRQGYDVGTQYRSAIFYHSEAQKKVAEEQIKKLEAAKVFDDPIVTEVTKASTFYVAEDYHQDYYRLNKNNPFGNVGYCRRVIAPKLEKLGLEK